MKVKYIVYIMGGINITVYIISNTHLFFAWGLFILLQCATPLASMCNTSCFNVDNNCHTWEKMNIYIRK